MMPRLTADHLYRLIPAVYRSRDAQAGQGALRGLVEVLAREGRVVEDDIAQLYDDWFIETCDEWVVPYIAELLGVRGLRDLGEGVPFSRRALVANTVAYRRRKGTVAVLEQLAFDTTGWRAKAVEFFLRLATTQHVNHVRLAAPGWASLAAAEPLERVGTPFDVAPYSADMRRIEVNRGRHNIPNVGLFLWRLGAYRLSRSEPASGPNPDSYFLSPLALDTPCFNPPHTETDITSATGEVNVPAPLRRRPLYDELEARRQALVDGREPQRRWFDDRPGGGGVPFEILLDGVPVPVAQLQVCDLSHWTAPPDTRDYPQCQPDGSTVTIAMPIAASIDPVRGRVVLAPAHAGAQVRVSWSYGGAGDLGGGPYSRQVSVEDALAWRVGPDADAMRPTWQIGVSRLSAPVAGQVVGTLAEAIDAWHARPADVSFGLITLMDSSTWAESFTGAARIRIPSGCRLVITAADWPALPVEGGLPGQLGRRIGRVTADGVRAHLRGSIDVVGTAPAGDEAAGELILDGLLIEGDLRVLDGNLRRLRLAHCTIVPGRGRLRVTSGNADLSVELERSICGAIAVPAAIERVSLRDTIVQAVGAPTAIDLDACRLSAAASTILGRATVQSVEASDCIFAGRLTAARRQEGCVRYSYLADDAAAPRRYRCQPDLAVGDAAGAAAAAIRARLRPTFASSTYGEPGYGQLAATCAQEIALGAEDGAEMGALNFVKQAHRLANLRSQLDDYLRFGLEAGIQFVT
jgi:hypothetical protein